MKNAKIALVLTSFFLLTFSASAVEYGGIGGKPAFPREDAPRSESIFIHTLNPGEVKEEGLLVVNNTQEEKTLEIYAVDSTPSTGGAFACEQMSETPDGVGSWIDLEKSEVTLAPGTNEVVPFKISVPQLLDVGEHNGCVMTQEKLEDQEAQGMSLSMRSGLRVAITIPGELVKKLEVEDFQVAGREDNAFLLQPKLKNLGNVSVETDLAVVTEHFFGFASLPHFEHGGEFTVLRGESADYNFELKQPFWGGWYRSSFVATYEDELGKKVQLVGEPVVFFSMPTTKGLLIEIGALFILVFGLILLSISIKRRNWIQRFWVERKVQSGDDIRSLAEKFDVSWKVIAKANNLQAPYILKTGEKIKLPPLAEAPKKAVESAKSVKKPVAGRSVAKKSTAKKPAAKKPATKKSAK